MLNLLRGLASALFGQWTKTTPYSMFCLLFSGLKKPSETNCWALSWVLLPPLEAITSMTHPLIQLGDFRWLTHEGKQDQLCTLQPLLDMHIALQIPSTTQWMQQKQQYFLQQQYCYRIVEGKQRIGNLRENNNSKNSLGFFVCLFFKKTKQEAFSCSNSVTLSK